LYLHRRRCCSRRCRCKAWRWARRTNTALVEMGLPQDWLGRKKKGVRCVYTSRDNRAQIVLMVE
jgi:hypothetical protein